MGDSSNGSHRSTGTVRIGSLSVEKMQAFAPGEDPFAVFPRRFFIEKNTLFSGFHPKRS